MIQGLHTYVLNTFSRTPALTDEAAQFTHMYAFGQQVRGRSKLFDT